MTSSIKNNFCGLPWLHRIINLSQPWYKFCCVSPNMRINSVSDISNDPALLRVKEQLYKNEQPGPCDFCWHSEDKGIRSYRQIMNHLDRKARRGGLVVLEINLENTCNLRCINCGPMFSSRWDQLNQYKGDSTLVENNVLGTLDILRENKDSLRRIVISGGEPSIIPNFYRIIETIQQNLNTNVEIWINSNGMFNTRIGNRFVETIQNLTKTHQVCCFWSCDGHGKLGEFLRDGLDYEIFKNNIKLILETTSAKHKLQITTSALNLTSQIDLIEDILRLSRMPIKNFYQVQGKPWLSVENFGNLIDELITAADIDRLKNLEPSYGQEMANMVGAVRNMEPNIEVLKYLSNYLKSYGEDINKTTPIEISKIINLIDISIR